jgi:hypothetical protein
MNASWEHAGIELVHTPNNIPVGQWEQSVDLQEVIDTMRNCGLPLGQLSLRSGAYIEAPDIPEPEAQTQARHLVLGTNAENDFLIVDDHNKAITLSSSPQSIGLTPAEYGILKLCANDPGHPMTIGGIAETIGTYGKNTIPMHVLRLRKNLGAQRHLIATRRGFGYYGVLAFNSDEFLETRNLHI